MLTDEELDRYRRMVDPLRLVAQRDEVGPREMRALFPAAADALAVLLREVDRLRAELAAGIRGDVFAGPHAELWGLLCPDCGPNETDAIAAAALAEVVRLRAEVATLAAVSARIRRGDPA
jgi:hypothetical protein